MKAIIKVNKNSAYAKYNYLTFEVNYIVNGSLININIKGANVDFSFKEVIIVDFEKEINKFFLDFSAGEIFFILNYRHINKINYSPVQRDNKK